MSTIQHRAIHLNLWWYAVAAVLAGAVLALMIATLQNSGQGQAVQDDHDVQLLTHGHFRANPYACYAGHPVPNIELPGCVSPMR
jgi:hypothetical protein